MYKTSIPRPSQIDKQYITHKTYFMAKLHIYALKESNYTLTQNIYLIHSNNTCIKIVFVKGTIHSLDQKMIRQHYDLQK